jgi:hypothetical protein
MYDLKTFQFGKGNHSSREVGMCVMEAVSYLAGEAHSDHPTCASPVITPLAIWVNDSCSDELRNELLRDLPWRIVGTKASEEIERQRAYMAADWAVRFVCPILLDRAGLGDEAAKLRNHVAVTDEASAASARAAAYAAYAAARAADAADAARAAYAAAYAAYDLEIIQRSCVELLDRMIRLTEPQEVSVVKLQTVA